jgi:hypothetical protein
MFYSVALNVVIGLVFIYLLYSLLATVISELIATAMGLRARNLKEAIDRMLNDEKPAGFWLRLWDTLRWLKNPKNKSTDAFYNHPEIKYLGSSGVFRAPSNIKPQSFSRALMSMLFGDEKWDAALIEDRLQACSETAKNAGEVVRTLDPETARYLQILWLEAKGDVEKFRLELENWFDRTMEQTIEWYKRKIRAILLILGLLLAWFFNADTFVIVKTLSTDKDAREQLVSMANAYIASNQFALEDVAENDSTFSAIKARIDSLMLIKQELVSDINKANTILGTGSWPSDPDMSCKAKISHMFALLYHHFFGYLVTAIAISLGAPFWFDLLNKIMALRTSKKPEPTADLSSPKK